MTAVKIFRVELKDSQWLNGNIYLRNFTCQCSFELNNASFVNSG